MTSRRWAAVGLILAPLWALAAWKLGDTVVPADLVLPDIDASQAFGAQVVADAESYAWMGYVTWAGAKAAQLLMLALYVRFGIRFIRDSAAGPIGTGMLLGMLGLGLVWFTGIPFRVLQLWWDRRHDVSEMGYLEYILGDWLTLTGAFLSISFALLVIMFLGRLLRDYWWLPGAAVFTGVVAAFSVSFPYLVPESEPLDDAALIASADRFERDQGLPDIPIRVEPVSDDTDDANAFATGFGPTRRIYLWDTLLDGRYTRAEEESVIAHELAHHSSDHLREGVYWFGLFALPGSYLLMLVTRRRGGISRPEAIPLALFVTVAFYFLLSPVQNGISRRMEQEADWKALESTRDPDALRGVMEGFAEQGAGDPDPPALLSWFLDTHPPLVDRVAMARAWAARRDTR